MYETEFLAISSGKLYVINCFEPFVVLYIQGWVLCYSLTSHSYTAICSCCLVNGCWFEHPTHRPPAPWLLMDLSLSGSWRINIQPNTMTKKYHSWWISMLVSLSKSGFTSIAMGFLVFLGESILITRVSLQAWEPHMGNTRSEIWLPIYLQPGNQWAEALTHHPSYKCAPCPKDAQISAEKTTPVLSLLFW